MKTCKDIYIEFMNGLNQEDYYSDYKNSDYYLQLYNKVMNNSEDVSYETKGNQKLLKKIFSKFDYNEDMFRFLIEYLHVYNKSDADEQFANFYFDNIYDENRQNSSLAMFFILTSSNNKSHFPSFEYYLAVRDYLDMDILDVNEENKTILTKNFPEFMEIFRITKTLLNVIKLNINKYHYDEDQLDLDNIDATLPEDIFEYENNDYLWQNYQDLVNYCIAAHISLNEFRLSDNHLKSLISPIYTLIKYESEPFSNEQASPMTVEEFDVKHEIISEKIKNLNKYVKDVKIGTHPTETSSMPFEIQGSWVTMKLANTKENKEFFEKYKTR